MEFTAKESMSRVVVQIWDGETGELLFARDLSMMLGVNLEMNFDSSSYHVRDSWTKKLLQSASNRKREQVLIFYSIRQDIFGIGKTGGFMEAIA